MVFLVKNTEEIPCPLCGVSNDYTLATYGYPNQTKVRNVICKQCGLIRINPRMAKEDYERFYRDEFFNYLDPYNRPAYVEEIEHTIDDGYLTPTKKDFIPFVIGYVPYGGEVLDIGAGFGQSLYLLNKERGITATGLEPDRLSRELASKKMGVTLSSKIVEEFLLSNNKKFDLVILNQTLEHLLTPLEILKGLSKILKPKGVIFIGVPNTYDPKISMDIFYQVGHTFNYTPHTLNLFARRAGLKIIKLRMINSALEVIMASKESIYTEVSELELKPGSDWRGVVKILRRKRMLNRTRGFAKHVLSYVFGDKFMVQIRDFADSLFHYRY